MLLAVIVGSLCSIVGALTVVVAIRRVNLTAWKKWQAQNEEDMGKIICAAIRINEKCEALYLDRPDPRLLVMAKDSKRIHTLTTRVWNRAYGQGRLFDGEDQDSEAVA